MRQAGPVRRRGSVPALGLPIIIVTIVALALTGCNFSAQDEAANAGAFSSNNESMQIESQPPPRSTPQPQPPQPPPTGPCVDPDPAVIATCLASTGGLIPGDDTGDSTIVAERTTGRIIASKRYGPQRVIASFDVDGSGDGGLIAFAMSPTYAQDRLIYALITTPSDNRIVRLAPGDVAKPILVGIPRGATGNMGAMAFKSPTELIVATGNAGNPGAANDPGSLAGKVLSVTSLSSGANPRPRILASGLGANVGLCPSPTGNLYVTDQAPTEDRLQVLSGTDLRVLWTWPDRPQVAGCAVAAGQIFVTTTRTQRIEALTEPTRDKPTITPPTVALEKRYGALGRIVALESGILQFATVNKASGRPVGTDDRVVKYFPPSQAEDRT